uniref:major capsid protein n=1 Tax=Rugamonas sp. CCM 8940 TaxID=2765359 RepID=UPI00351BEF98
MWFSAFFAGVNRSALRALSRVLKEGKKMKVMKKIGLGLVGAVAATAPVFALAAPPDLSSLTSAIDLSTVITAVLAVAAIIAGVYAAIKGAKTVLGLVKGG